MDLGLGGFHELDPKGKGSASKKERTDYVKLKSLCTAEEAARGAKRPPPEGTRRSPPRPRFHVRGRRRTHAGGSERGPRHRAAARGWEGAVAPAAGVIVG